MDCVEKQIALYTEKPAWHKKGQVISREEARKLTPVQYLDKAGLGYDIEYLPVSVNDKPVHDRFFLGRSTDGLLLSRTTVTSGYRAFSPKQIVEHVFQNWYDQGIGHMESAFGLFPDRERGFGSESVYLCMAVDLEFKLPDEEPTRIYLGIHDRMLRRGRMKVTTIRAECANMVAAVFGSGFDLSFGHDSKGEDTLKFANQNWKQATEIVRRATQNAIKLKRANVDVPLTIDALLKINEKRQNGEKISTQLFNRREDWIQYSNSPGLGTLGQTAWDVYQGLTALHTHGPMRSKSSYDETDRLALSLAGEQGRREQKVFDTLLSMV